MVTGQKLQCLARVIGDKSLKICILAPFEFQPSFIEGSQGKGFFAIIVMNAYYDIPGVGPCRGFRGQLSVHPVSRQSMSGIRGDMVLKRLSR